MLAESPGDHSAVCSLGTTSPEENCPSWATLLPGMKREWARVPISGRLCSSCRGAGLSWQPHSSAASARPRPASLESCPLASIRVCSSCHLEKPVGQGHLSPREASLTRSLPGFSMDLELVLVLAWRPSPHRTSHLHPAVCGVSEMHTGDISSLPPSVFPVHAGAPPGYQRLW